MSVRLRTKWLWVQIPCCFELLLSIAKYSPSSFYSVCGNRECCGSLQNKSVWLSFILVSKYIFFLAKLKRRGRHIFQVCKEGTGCGRWQRETSENFPPLLCYLLDPHKIKYSRACTFITNFVDRFRDLSNKSCCQQGEGLIITQSLQERMFQGMWCCHTDHALLESSSWHGYIKFLN